LRGANLIQGGAGDDSLMGGNAFSPNYNDGRDTLDGGLGADTLVGGIGVDVFRMDDSIVAAVRPRAHATSSLAFL